MMAWKLECWPEPAWPQLAWLAEVREDDPVVRVRHGRAVETNAEWFCEGVWDGAFEAGDFDATDLVFGSGGRLRQGKVIFVSSGSTVDRLQWIRLSGRVMVSNSLACLLAVSEVRVDPRYERYPEFFRSIVDGIDAYEKMLPTLSGHVELCYYRNLAWDGHHLQEEDKPDIRRDFGTFDTYRAFLRHSLGEIARNMNSPARLQQYEMISALSSGYDSTAATVLGREVGMRCAFSFERGRGGAEDHGKEVARILDLDLVVVKRDDWRRRALAEVPYFATTGLGADVIFSGAGERLLNGRVLLTGFHGDKIWGKQTQALGPTIVRGDASGLSFSEHRLDLVCIHLPVPFLGVRQIRDIHSLSNSADLARWDVPGEYSRPVPRRIIEEAEVPRGHFGVAKQAATGLFRKGEALLTEETRAKYHGWLAQRVKDANRFGAQSKQIRFTLLLTAVRKRFHLITRAVRGVSVILPARSSAALLRGEVRLQRWLNRRINMVSYLFPWAIEAMAARYKSRTEQV